MLLVAHMKRKKKHKGKRMSDLLPKNDHKIYFNVHSHQQCMKFLSFLSTTIILIFVTCVSLTVKWYLNFYHDSYYPNDKWCKTFFHRPFGQLYLFFKNDYVQLLAPIFLWLVFFFFKVLSMPYVSWIFFIFI